MANRVIERRDSDKGFYEVSVGTDLGPYDLPAPDPERISRLEAALKWALEELDYFEHGCELPTIYSEAKERASKALRGD